MGSKIQWIEGIYACRFGSKDLGRMLLKVDQIDSAVYTVERRLLALIFSLADSSMHATL